MVDKRAVLVKIFTFWNELLEHKAEWNIQDVFGKIRELDASVRCMNTLDLVRCRDCKRFVDNREARVTYCNRGLKMWYMRPDDFCSHGERRDDENH
jgi:hypothetical protein